MSFSFTEAAALCFSGKVEALGSHFPLVFHSFVIPNSVLISDNVTVKFQWEMQLDWLFRNPLAVLIRTPQIILSFPLNSSSILPIFQITFYLSSRFTISNSQNLSVFSFDVCFILCFLFTTSMLSASWFKVAIHCSQFDLYLQGFPGLFLLVEVSC